MFSVIRWLFGQRPAKPVSTEISQPHIGDMTHDEASHYYEDRRQDPAALDRRRSGSRQLDLVQSTAPVCPACGESLGSRKPPSRKSNFKCKKCKAQLYADPEQGIFESVYLTEKQKDLVDFLWQLDRWIYTAGSIHDFCWAKAQIGKADALNSDDVVSDTIWFLLNYNLKNLLKINPGIDAFGVKTYSKDIGDLVESFREAQKEWKS